MVHAPVAEDDVRTAGVTYFDPEDYAVHLIKRAVAHGQDIVISATTVGEVFVLGGRGEYFAAVTSMQEFCTVPAFQLNVTLLKPETIPPALTTGHGRNIDELMWLAAFHASDGRLMTGCYRDDVVELAYWPNFSRLPHTPNALRIAALLTGHPTSITLTGRLLKVEREELYQFYSAARSAGIAQAINRKAETPSLPPHRHQTLLSSLLSKIAGL